MGVDTVEHRIVSIYDLVPHKQNYNKHPQEQLERLKASLRRFSQVEDAVVKALPNGKYKIAAHEGVTTAALQLIEAGECLHLERWGITIVPQNWTEIDILGYMTASNETARLSNPDQVALAELLQQQQDAGFLLESIGSSEQDLQQMLEELGDAYVGESVERDEAEDELPESVETRAKVGDVWQLGRHIVGCGDSCDIGFVRELLNGKVPDMVFTDPPYNCADEMSESFYVNTDSQAMKKLSTSSWDKGFKIEDFLKVLTVVRPQNGTVYICTSHILAPAIWQWMKEQKSTHHQYVVWCKSNPMPSLAKRHFTWATELICYAAFGKHVFNFPEEGHSLSWWDIPTNNANRLHPTQKPLEIPMKALSHSSNKGDMVFDGFLGSGSTLIAAERLERRCVGIEIDPHFCDIILARYEAETGQTATLLERVEEVTSG